jgi:hypothetical protein
MARERMLGTVPEVGPAKVWETGLVVGLETGKASPPGMLTPG